MTRAEFLQNWTSQVGLPLTWVTAEARLPQPVVAAILAGEQEPSFDEIESLARALGLRAEDLYEETVSPTAGDAIRVLMKSAETFSPGPEVRLRMLDAARSALDLLDLLGSEAPRRAGYQPLRALRSSTAPRKPLFEQGADLARQVRKRLAISSEISSMRDFVVDTLGIPIVAARLRAEGPDAFTIFGPGVRPVIVLNLDGKNEHGLVRRFSLAHEVYHALFDQPGAAASVACHIDPDVKLDRETRANAFAMRLLLPEKEITKLSEHDIARPGTLRGLMERWGVHRSALMLYVKKVRKLSDEEAARDLPTVDSTCPSRWREAEELPAERAGVDEVPIPRRGLLLQKLVEAYRADKLSMGAVRDNLHVDATVSVEHLATVLDLPPRARDRGWLARHDAIAGISALLRPRCLRPYLSPLAPGSADGHRCARAPWRGLRSWKG
jgi:Zn-dependent peptidase ImmA (M78 family)